MSKHCKFTRKELCYLFQQQLLDGRNISPACFRTLCASTGGHEPSRILDDLRNRRGVPVKRSVATGGLYVKCKDRNLYQADPVGTLSNWRSSAAERALDRKLMRLSKTLEELSEKRSGGLLAALRHAGIII